MRVVLKFILMVGDLLGLNRFFRRRNGTAFRVLMYHGVSSETSLDCWTVIPLDEFNWQMEYLGKHYQVEPAETLLTNVSDLSDRVVITFDDGLLNTYTHAWPILKRLKLRALILVLPGPVESGDIIWADKLFQLLHSTERGELDLNQWELGTIRLDDAGSYKGNVVDNLLNKLKRSSHQKRVEVTQHIERQLGESSTDHGPFALMDQGQLKELAQSEEFSIGSHTLNHPILSTMNREEQEREISGCLVKLSEWGLSPLPIFAYPNGRPVDYNDDSVAILKENGVSIALSTIDGHHERTDNPFHVKRIPIGNDTSRWEFKARLSGFYYWLKALA